MEEIFRDIVKRVVDGFDPEKIILFGSFAREDSGPDSDADLLVVMKVLGSKRKEATKIDLALEGIPIPTDILVMTPEEVEQRSDTPGSIVREALRTGKVLYERAA